MCQTVLIQEERLQIPTKRKLFGGKKNGEIDIFVPTGANSQEKLKWKKHCIIIINSISKDILCCETFPHTPPNGPLSLSKQLSLSTSTENGLYI